MPDPSFNQIDFGESVQLVPAPEHERALHRTTFGRQRGRPVHEVLDRFRYIAEMVKDNLEGADFETSVVTQDILEETLLMTGKAVLEFAAKIASELGVYYLYQASTKCFCYCKKDNARKMLQWAGVTAPNVEHGVALLHEGLDVVVLGDGSIRSYPVHTYAVIDEYTT